MKDWKSHNLPGLMGAIGPLLSKKSNGCWHYGLVITNIHLNAAGYIHGGTITTLIDHALSAHGWQLMNKTPCITLQLNTNFIHSATIGDFLIVKPRLVRQTKTLLFLEAEVTANQVIVATAQAIFKCLPPKKPAATQAPYPTPASPPRQSQ